MPGIIDLLDRPIAFHRSFVTLTGSVTAALMLSQAVYWARRTTDPEGWFYKTQEEWEEETGLSRSEQEGARKCLRALGFWHEERRGVPARLYFRIDTEVLANKIAENPQTSLRKTCNLDCGKPANKIAENPQTLTTEITTEITTETTTERRESDQILERGESDFRSHAPPQKDPIQQRRETHRNNLALEEQIFKSIGTELTIKLRELQEISGRRGAAWWGWLREHVAPHMDRLGAEFPAGVAAAIKAFHGSNNPQRWGLQDFVRALETYVPPPKPVRKPSKEESLTAILSDILAEEDDGTGD